MLERCQRYRKGVEHREGLGIYYMYRRVAGQGKAELGSDRGQEKMMKEGDQRGV